MARAGPLLFHYVDMDDEMSIELSWEELRATFQPLGLKLLVWWLRCSLHHRRAARSAKRRT